MESRFSHSFRAPIDLKVMYPVPQPQASMLGSSATYVAPLFKRRGIDYTVDVPVSHALAPGEADRMLVLLTAAAASVHDFRVTLLSSIGSVDCGAVRLETFGTEGGLHV